MFVAHRPAKRHLILAAAISLTLLTACNDKQASSSAAAAASVDGVKIPESQVSLLLKHLMNSQDQPELNTENARKMVLEQLTMQLLLSQQAQKEGVDKQPEIRDQLELARQSVLSNAYIQKKAQANSFSEAELAAEYEKIKQQLGGTEYKARHILVDDEALARDLIAKLKADPKAFASLAKQHSNDPGSREQGGELGWFNPAAMVAEFATALKDMQAGQTTQEPVKTEYGYHVIQVEDTRSRMVPPLAEIEPMLRQQMQQQRIKKLIAELKDKAKIEITPQVEAAAGKPAESADSLPEESQPQAAPAGAAN